jgi:hypothetical protein
MLVTVALCANVASADPIATGSVEWKGATASVEYLGSSGDLYDFRYVFDFEGFTATGHTDYLVGINFKPSQGDVISYQDASTIANGSWAYGVDTNLSSAGFGATCGAGTTGNNNFFCGATTNYLANPTSGSPVYTWDFTLRITGVTDPNLLVINAPIRALFTSGILKPKGAGYYTSLMSEKTVPEPGTLALVGIGLAVAAIRRRKKR